MQKILSARSALALLFLSLCFIGCDPAYSLWIDNRSGRDRNITIIYYEQYAKSYRACQWADTYFMNYIAFSGNDTAHSHGLVMRKDTLSREWTKSYSFILPAFNIVRTEGGLGVSPPEQLIVVDHTDTISTSGRSGKYRYKPGFVVGNKHVLTLNDSLQKQ